MDELIENTLAAIKGYNPDKTHIPIRSGFNYEIPHSGLVEWMPLHQKEKVVNIKVVGYHPNNPQINNWPTILSTISTYDTTSGHLISIMDGVLLTALRTGAASAVASQYLAHPESKILGLIGCGAQSITQLHALSRVFNLQQVMFYDVDNASMLSFQKRCEALNLNLTYEASTIETIVNNADILTTATSVAVGQGPLFENLSSKEHLHINAVGADFPGKVEIPLDFLEKSFVCPDFIGQALIEGECQQLKMEQIGADWTQIIQQPAAYPTIQNERSVFDSTGWALEDYVVMELFRKYATVLEVGQYVAIEYIPEDAKNPYHFMQSNMETLKLVGKKVLINS